MGRVTAWITGVMFVSFLKGLLGIETIKALQIVRNREHLNLPKAGLRCIPL